MIARWRVQTADIADLSSFLWLEFPRPVSLSGCLTLCTSEPEKLGHAALSSLIGYIMILLRTSQAESSQQDALDMCSRTSLDPQEPIAAAWPTGR